MKKLQNGGGQRFGIRNFLQTEWEKTVYTKSLPYNIEKMKDTADCMLKVSQFF